MSPMKKKKPSYTGLSINRHSVELAIYGHKTNAIEKSVILPLPPGIFDADGDQIVDPVLLKQILAQVLRACKPAPNRLHLSLPGTLLRMVDMPRMDADALYLSLSSEAERYRTFDGTEAIVDFKVLEGERSNNSQQTVVFGAVRSDSLNTYLKILKELRIKPVTIGLEPLNILRAMAGTGVLDGLIQEIGLEAYWGTLFVEASRVRLMIWQGNRLIDLRETSMDAAQFTQGGSDFFVIEDLLEEIRRTTKNCQPLLWLANELPESFRESLSERLNCPVYPTVVGEALMQVDAQPVNLSTIGAAMVSLVDYPFDFDIAEGLAQLGGSSGSGSGAKDFGATEENGPGPLILAGGVLSLLAIVVSIILALMNTLTQQQMPTLTSQRDSAQMQVSALQSQEASLKHKAVLDKSLLEAVKNARIRNQIYIALTSDLKRKTPQQVWIQTLTAGENLSVSGKAMNQSAVIHFAQSFDDAPYTKAILIDSITEERLKSATLYDFKFSGGIRLAPQLLPPDPTTPEPAEEGHAQAQPPFVQAKV
jgi:Tfp pilus assembly PilM family ATPase